MPAGRLGYCHIHEHVWVRPTPMSASNPALCIDDHDASLRELESYRAHGGVTLVDAQPVGAGRDARMLERLSRESGVHIIASTGYHLLGFYQPDSWLHVLDGDALRELYQSELTRGMLPWTPDDSVVPGERTTLRAGLVKAAIPAEGPTGRYETLLRAAAGAAANAGVPLMLHTEYGAHAMDALEMCAREGLKPQKLIVCHVDRQAKDFAPHDELAQAGVYLDYDTIARYKYHSDEDEVALLRHMLPYEDQILLSLDTTSARLAAYGGTPGLCYLLDDFDRRLLDAGFPQATLDRYHRLNVQRLFER